MLVFVVVFKFRYHLQNHLDLRPYFIQSGDLHHILKVVFGLRELVQEVWGPVPNKYHLTGRVVVLDFDAVEADHLWWRTNRVILKTHKVVLFIIQILQSFLN